jgi:hypothetical protein
MPYLTWDIEIYLQDKSVKASERIFEYHSVAKARKVNGANFKEIKDQFGSLS